jgi:hypothetical protein
MLWNKEEVEALIAQLFLKTINMWKKLMISLNGIMKSNDSGRRVKDGFKMGV